MKKFITVAALLAAGTAFSNAAVTLVSGFDGFDSSLKSNLGSQELTLTLGAGAVSGGVLTTSTTDGTDNKSLIDLSSLSLGSDGYTVSISFNSSTASGSSAYATLATSSNVNAMLARYEGTNAVGIMDNGASSGRPATAISSSITLTSPFTLTFAVAADGSYTLFVTQDETTQALTWSGKSHANETPTSLYLGAWGNLVNYKLSVEVSKVSVWSGTATESDLPAIINIPEPSAFGLLAGVGALALVASRRRRTK